MRILLTAVILALIGLVVAFEVEDQSRDLKSKERHRRWLFTDKCKAHSDCGSNACCDYSWFGNSCIRKRGLFRSCSNNPKCGCMCECQQGLECKQFRLTKWPYYRFSICLRPTTPPPTEEPGSGDFA
ncbi:uncharacterized protein LOC110247588 [Exaiptasia diaphana]|uniref:Uncharacterized protein n=1 Tax=Exaiptasia diaphana TaxID=2652724 RepID=A0A913XTZ4_EXADI|nr:uncharacterized protein LOC110247588 [Exaiptasia diaphana]KXJ29376.1 hypothetical protein AC249_AIPGENE27006 [Exaiptasia diaphana]